MDQTMFRTAPGAQRRPSASKLMVPFPLFGNTQILPTKHSGGASSKTVFTVYSSGKFSLSMERNTHCPRTALRHCEAVGPLSEAPRWGVHAPRVKTLTTRAARMIRNLFMMIFKLYMLLR